MSWLDSKLLLSFEGDKNIKNPALRPGSEVFSPKEILRELHREIREKMRYPIPNSEVVRNVQQNPLGTFCKHYWDVLCAKYELLTPSGVRELTEVASHAKFALFGSSVQRESHCNPVSDGLSKSANFSASHFSLFSNTRGS